MFSKTFTYQNSSLLVGCTDLYPHGFNGKRKDDDINVAGGSYDFGDRIYDSRLGRWLSIDKLAHVHPDWSPYRGFLDNPIVYVDPDGKTEFESITINDQRTGKVTIIRTVVSEKLMITSQKPGWNSFDTQVDQTTWSDIVHNTNITIDKNGVVTKSPMTTSAGNVRTVMEGPFRNSETSAMVKVSGWKFDEMFKGKGGSQKGGYVYTSKGGGPDPSRVRSLSDAEERDIESLLSALGALGSGNIGILGKASTGEHVSDIIKDVSGIINNTKDAVDNFSGRDKTRLDTTDKFCRDCRQVRDGKTGKVKVDDGVSPKDSINMDQHD